VLGLAALTLPVEDIEPLGYTKLLQSRCIPTVKQLQYAHCSNSRFAQMKIVLCNKGERIIL